ncbi:ATP-binding protein [Nostoc sp. CHAB 5784]|uniref:ATP-binding protein n=1 Tax=Nostoc mirabile TaxID=2907820 RepID=UPI001E543FF3|nr:ATP-binding protein [Nostoc mirabile]MCC5666842.1 ATP-binding protein [Nostoc mirabile CHAB5784]
MLIQNPSTVSGNGANHHHLMDALEVIRELLEAKSNSTGEDVKTHSQSSGNRLEGEARSQIVVPPTIKMLCERFGLSNFERDVLLLCAGMEFDSSWASLCAEINGDRLQNYPTFSLALAVLPAPNWAALTPSANLRRWRLIEVGAGNTLTSSPLRIDERILHYLAGVQHLDDRLLGIVEPLTTEAYLVPSHAKLTQEMVATWVKAANTKDILPVLQLCGGENASKRAIAMAVCGAFGLNLFTISAQTIPTDISQLQLLKCLCEREYHLSSMALLWEWDEGETGEKAKENAIARLIESIDCPLITSSSDRRRQKQRPIITFDVHHPTAAEQQAIWLEALGDIALTLNGEIQNLVSHFHLSPAAIHSACLQVSDSETEIPSQLSIAQQLWHTCRAQARPRLDDMAQRLESGASWDELVLPDKEKQVLREIAAHVRQRTKVYDDWGFGGKGKRGLGISALFAGTSGTGKTMAAEVLAQELQLDLYRIDISAIVSKYIGETEKNLRQVFDAAETGGVILLFDEADAIFGKRSEVKDARDRYANMEVSYLLQRMESYRGLSILTTNLKGSIDQAFLRRIRFITQFPFPDASQRAEIWRRVFPKATPTEKLNI